jgi:light-regulated signal transduction histidine kinase (bacteriophytochrome)
MQVMLEISARKVAQVAMMARELNRAEGELRAFVDRLNEDEQAELVAVMWIGRESFFAEDLAEAIATAKSEASTPCADYLLGTPHLSDHLENGLDALGISAEDVENDLM